MNRFFSYVRSGYLALLLMMFVITGCSKDGDTGPAGADGNANVKYYLLDGFTHVGSEESRIFNQSSEEFNKSLILVYGDVGEFTYPLPGYVTPSFYYRIFFRNLNDKTSIFINRISGNGSQIFKLFRVYVIPASSAPSNPNQRSAVDITGAYTPSGDFYSESELQQMSYSEFRSAFGIQ